MVFSYLIVHGSWTLDKIGCRAIIQAQAHQELFIQNGDLLELCLESGSHSC